MKRFVQSLLLVAFFIGVTVPAWSQTSTQGKEFWVSLIPSQSPDGTSLTSNGFKPYLAISAPKACKVTISNPNTGWSVVKNIPTDNAWAEIKDIPNTEWFGSSIPATETVLNTGLKIVATEEVSVFCALLWSKSFDATNVLPVTALQSDYIVQTYEAAEGNGKKQNGFTVLAAEDCIVDITPAAQTEGGKTAPFSVTLKAGQNYHVLSAETKNLSGSRVTARDGKKIAVFAGAPLNRVPNNYSDRDLLYEQLFPIDYWGQNFIVSRSKKKDANRVIITAQEDATQVTIYGKYDPTTTRNADHTLKTNYSFTLGAGQSYEFEMSAGNQTGVKWKSESNRESFAGLAFVDSTVFIQTSCPCAVLSYDVGNSYYRDDAGVETEGSGDDHLGAPSMTWVSPIEQMINDIVFGVMGTGNTTKHFINIIANTSDISNIKLNNVSLASQFKPVENNPSYSYARITLRETTPGNANPFYHLESQYGFIATVYGNGDDESYAYSVGSSAVKRGVNIEGTKFINNMRAEEPFCINNVLRFDPQVNTDIIDKVVWDFGDGTSTTTLRADGIVAEHMYTTPGWYDVTALISAHKDCPYSSYPEEAVSFSFRVVEADTIPAGSEHDCIEADSTYKGVKLSADSIQYLLTHGANDTLWDKRKKCYDPVEIKFMTYGIKTTYEYSTTEKDSAYLNGKWYFPETVPEDGKVTWTSNKLNQYDCDSIITCNLTITSCLNVVVANNAASQYVCGGEKMDVAYEITKGEAGDATVALDGQAAIRISLDKTTRGKGIMTLPTENLKPGKHHADIMIEDVNCGGTVTKAYDFTVYYPSSIFVQKFNNVLAVYKKGHGGNEAYDFTAYQWYYNGAPIEGATESIYHANGKMASGSYYVLLTRADMEALPSCPITINEDTLPNYDKNEAPARKMIQNNRMVIIKDGRTYDMYGQRVE